jgi:hypothetical protein
MFASETLITLKTVLLMSIPPVMLMLVQLTDWNFVVPDTERVPVTFALSTFMVRMSTSAMFAVPDTLRLAIFAKVMFAVGATIIDVNSPIEAV